jgi:hypothetical protein
MNTSLSQMIYELEYNQDIDLAEKRVTQLSLILDEASDLSIDDVRTLGLYKELILDSRLLNKSNDANIKRFISRFI